jgi:hypothetical protein
MVHKVYYDLLTKLGVKTMTKEYNDVYGKTDLDYANEFNEFNVAQQVECSKINECQKECNDESNTGGCQGS